MTANTLHTFDGVVRQISKDGSGNGPLVGLSFAAKDSYDVEGYVTGCGNPDWERTHEPARETADAVTLLLNNGASLQNKSCTDELAYSLDGVNVHFGVPLNPQYSDRIPGGSSSGSASMVGAAMVDFALGSDTSGSIRVPASNCGIYSMRPSHGRISTRGLVPLAPSFDTVAWFARSAELLARCGAVLLDEPLPELKLSEIRLVVLQSAFDSLEKQIRDDLLSYGARISSAFGAHTIERQITYDRLSEWASRYRHLQAFEAWREHGDWVTNCRPKFDSLIEQRFKFASTVTREQYEANLPIRTELVEMLKSHLDERSVLCLPPTWNIPPLISATSEELLQNREKNFTRACIATIAGAPQVTIPVPLQSGKKFGLSFLALPGKDTLLLKLATLLF